jgi:DNA-binding response OmpR family regulator
MSLASTLNNWLAIRPRAVRDSRTTGETNAWIETGAFKLDLNSRKAYVRDKELELSSAEFDLLRFLLSHPKKQLVTPRTVLTTDGGALMVRRSEFMKTLLSLRRKLDAVSAGEHYLRTEPWVVYSFSAAG